MRRGPIISLLIIWLSILCSAFLQVLPLPPFIDLYIRPHWMLLTSLYWCLAMPHRFNIGSTWSAGLILDVLWGTTLGLNAIAFGLCGAFIVSQGHKIRSYSVWHQALILMIIVSIYQWIIATLISLIDDGIVPEHYYFACFVTLLAWPWVFFTLRKARRRLFLS